MIIFTRIIMTSLSIAFSYIAIRDATTVLDAIVNLLWYNMFIWLVGYCTFMENLKQDKELEELRNFKRDCDASKD